MNGTSNFLDTSENTDAAPLNTEREEAALAADQHAPSHFRENLYLTLLFCGELCPLKQIHS